MTDTYSPISKEVEVREHQKCKIILKYIVCSRSIWVTWDPVSKTIEEEKEEKEKVEKEEWNSGKNEEGKARGKRRWEEKAGIVGEDRPHFQTESQAWTSSLLS